MTEPDKCDVCGVDFRFTTAHAPTCPIGEKEEREMSEPEATTRSPQSPAEEAWEKFAATNRRWMSQATTQAWEQRVKPVFLAGRDSLTDAEVLRRAAEIIGNAYTQYPVATFLRIKANAADRRAPK